MEKKLEDIITRNVIEFATSPYQRIYFNIKNIYGSKTESNLRMDPPLSLKGQNIQSISIFNQPKSDISRLIISSSNVRKENEIGKEINKTEKINEVNDILIEAPLLSPKEFEFSLTNADFKITDEYSEEHDLIHLENWFLVPIIVKSEINVAVFGFRLDIKETWCTDIIMHSISSSQIVTHSKTHYKLIGKINPERTSNCLTKYFDEGFPINWKEIIRNEFYCGERS